MKILRTTLILWVFALWGCSDDTEVAQGQGDNLAGETDKNSGEGKCGDEKSLALNAAYTYYSQPVQDVLTHCMNCHTTQGGNNPPAGVDFSDYYRMATSISELDLIKTQVDNGHEGPYSDMQRETITNWQLNQWRPGTPPGGADDSPFYEDGKGDNGIDLDGFDPFADSSDAGAAKENCAN